MKNSVNNEKFGYDKSKCMAKQDHAAFVDVT